MKIFASVLVALALLSVTASSDKPFAPPKDKDGKTHIKSTANFGNDGAQMQLCPSGDCTSGQSMKLIMHRLEEVGSDGKPANNKAENFQKLVSTWSDFTTVQVAGVNASQTSYKAVLNVGGPKNAQPVDFMMTASIFQANATVPYGDTTLFVPAGALKFTISMGAWPWLADTNMLQFGVQLITKNKDGKDGPKPERLPRNETKKLERMNLTDGMFMDTPVIALLDNVQTTVESTITDTELFWQFPHYAKTLFYDPVLGSEDASARVIAESDGSHESSGSAANGTSDKNDTSDKGFKPSREKDGKYHIKSAASFGNQGGAQMHLCPSGDCSTGQTMKLIMKRLEEVTLDGVPTKNKAENFQKTNYSWTDFTTVEVAGVNVSQTSYNSVLNVGNGKTNASVAFNITAGIFQANATVPYGDTTLNVPAGALKFTISMGTWPWMTDTNMLQFGIQLITKTKGGKDGPKPEKMPKNATKKLERTSLSEGMFMDAPVIALVDDVPTTINSTITDTEFYWQFPHYTTTLYYDPVLGSDDVSAQMTAADATVGVITGSGAGTAGSAGTSGGTTTTGSSTGTVKTGSTTGATDGSTPSTTTNTTGAASPSGATDNTTVKAVSATSNTSSTTGSHTGSSSGTNTTTNLKTGTSGESSMVVLKTSLIAALGALLYMN